MLIALVEPRCHGYCLLEVVVGLYRQKGAEWLVVGDQEGLALEYCRTHRWYQVLVFELVVVADWAQENNRTHLQVGPHRTG